MKDAINEGDEADSGESAPAEPESSEAQVFHLLASKSQSATDNAPPFLNRTSTFTARLFTAVAEYQSKHNDTSMADTDHEFAPRLGLPVFCRNLLRPARSELS